MLLSSLLLYSFHLPQIQLLREFLLPTDVASSMLSTKACYFSWISLHANLPSLVTHIFPHALWFGTSISLWDFLYNLIYWIFRHLTEVIEICGEAPWVNSHPAEVSNWAIGPMKLLFPLHKCNLKTIKMTFVIVVVPEPTWPWARERWRNKGQKLHRGIINCLFLDCKRILRPRNPQEHGYLQRDSKLSTKIHILHWCC